MATCAPGARVSRSCVVLGHTVQQPSRPAHSRRWKGSVGAESHVRVSRALQGFGRIPSGTSRDYDILMNGILFSSKKTSFEDGNTWIDLETSLQVEETEPTRLHCIIPLK